MSKSFLQSSQWADFQESVGRKVFWLENKLVIKHNLPLGLSYFYCPRPKFKDEQDFKKFAQEIKKLAKAENVVFIRLELDINSNYKIPIFNQTQNSIFLNIKTLKIDCKLKIKNLKLSQSKNLQPQDSLILNLKQSEAATLEQMHPKTRYNIRLAGKHGVEVIKSTNAEDIDIFYQLAIKTSERDRFSYHPKKYYQKMMETLGPHFAKASRDKKDGMVELFIAEIPKSPRHSDNSRRYGAPTEVSEKVQISNQIPNPNTKYDIQDTKYIPVASILVLFYKDTAIYLHGASDHQYRKFMAPYLLQWRAICEAKKRGCKSYDFWGICPPSAGISNFQFPPMESAYSGLIRSHRTISNEIQNPNVQKEYQCKEGHPWSGITRFKLGFAPMGRILHYPLAIDLIFQSFWYKLYKLAKK